MERGGAVHIGRRIGGLGVFLGYGIVVDGGVAIVVVVASG